jgi:hypothetical protein
MVEIETMDCVSVRCIDADNDHREGCGRISGQADRLRVFSAELSW